jgi:hypothetical protein
VASQSFKREKWVTKENCKETVQPYIRMQMQSKEYR